MTHHHYFKYQLLQGGRDVCRVCGKLPNVRAEQTLGNYLFQMKCWGHGGEATCAERSRGIWGPLSHGHAWGPGQCSCWYLGPSWWFFSAPSITLDTVITLTNPTFQCVLCLFPISGRNFKKRWNLWEKDTPSQESGPDTVLHSPCLEEEMRVPLPPRDWGASALPPLLWSHHKIGLFFYSRMTFCWVCAIRCSSPRLLCLRRRTCGLETNTGDD